MPMRVGIENGTKKGFTEEELGITNSFTMGILSMVTGVSGYWGKPHNWRTEEVMTVEKAHARFCMACHVDDTWDELKPYVTDINFVQRMADADWHTNCGSKTDQEFLEVMADTMIENAQRAIGDERVHLGWQLRRNFQGMAEREAVAKDRVHAALQRIEEAKSYSLCDMPQGDANQVREYLHDAAVDLVEHFNLYGRTIAWDEDDNPLVYEWTEDGNIVLTTKLEEEE
jgi:hypothetical protein